MRQTVIQKKDVSKYKKVEPAIRDENGLLPEETEELKHFRSSPVGYPAESRPQQERFDEDRIHLVQ